MNNSKDHYNDDNGRYYDARLIFSTLIWTKHIEPDKQFISVCEGYLSKILETDDKQEKKKYALEILTGVIHKIYASYQNLDDIKDSHRYSDKTKMHYAVQWFNNTEFLIERFSKQTEKKITLKECLKYTFLVGKQKYYGEYSQPQYDEYEETFDDNYFDDVFAPHSNWADEKLAPAFFKISSSFSNEYPDKSLDKLNFLSFVKLIKQRGYIFITDSHLKEVNRIPKEEKTLLAYYYRYIASSLNESFEEDNDNNVIYTLKEDPISEDAIMDDLLKKRLSLKGDDLEHVETILRDPRHVEILLSIIQKAITEKLTLIQKCVLINVLSKHHNDDLGFDFGCLKKTTGEELQKMNGGVQVKANIIYPQIVEILKKSIQSYNAIEEFN